MRAETLLAAIGSANDEYKYSAAAKFRAAEKREAVFGVLKILAAAASIVFIIGFAVFMRYIAIRMKDPAGPASSTETPQTEPYQSEPAHTEPIGTEPYQTDAGTDAITTSEPEPEPDLTPTPEKFFRSTADGDIPNAVNLCVETDLDYPENIVLPERYDGSFVVGFYVRRYVHYVQITLNEDEWYYDQYGYLIKYRTELTTDILPPVLAKLIYLPKRVRSLDLCEFDKCEQLTKLYFEDPDGWTVYESQTVDGKTVNSKHLDADPAVLSDPSAAAALVKELAGKGIYIWLKASYEGPMPETSYVFTELDDETLELSGVKDAALPERLELPTEYNGKKITAVSGFKGISGVKYVVIPEGYVKIQSSAFYACSDLTGVTLPDSLRYIGPGAFRNCKSLSGITVPKGVTVLDESVFCGCENLKSVTLHDGITEILDVAFGSCLSLTEFVIPASVTELPKYVFVNCADLKTVKLHDGITSISGDAFAGCTSLEYADYGNALYLGTEENPYQWCISAKDKAVKSVTLHKDTKSLASGAFYECTALENVTLCDGITELSDMLFFGCKKLDHVVIPGSVKVIGGNTFGCCTSLTDVKIPDGVEYIRAGAFSGCSALVDIALPGGVTVTGSYVFEDCTALQNVTIPDTAKCTGGGMFSGCTALEEFTVPFGFKRILPETFDGCVNLKRVIIPEGISAIDYYAFHNCTSLTKLTIPETLLSLGERAFQGCSSLTEINFEGDVYQWHTVSYIYETAREWEWADGSAITTVHCKNGDRLKH